MQGNVSRWIGVFRPALAVLGIAGASWVNTATASTSSAVSPLAMPIVGMAANDDAVTTCDTPSQSSGFSVASSSYSYQYAHWRPRRWREPREEPPPQYQNRYSEPKDNGFSQLHAGFLDPDGDQSASLILGYRMGFNVDKNVAIGGQLDWRHQGNQENTIISSTPGPGGTTIETETQVAKSSSDLIPILGVLQINIGNSGLIPYIGAGAGYEILHLASDDFVNGQEFRGTFGGFGWQLWAGAALPLGSNRTRLTGEAFLNQADLSRDVTDVNGQSVRETVNMDGTGARFGLQWAF
jgi:opacity protein-like surface antigen